MRVLHIINSLTTGGAENLLVETLPLLRENINVDLLLLNGADQPFLNKLRNSGVSVFYLTKGEERSVYNPLLVFKLMRYLKNYDILHVHLFPSLYWVVFAKILSLSSVKLIFTEHSTSNKRIQNKLFKPIERFIYFFYHRIICITPQVRDVMLEHLRCQEDKLIVIDNGVNVNLFFKAKGLERHSISSSILDTDKIIIMVAAFRREKDHETLLKALSLLPVNVKLLLVGNGDRRSEIINLIELNDLVDRVFLLGIRMDVPQLLKMADVAILSSHWEGFGLVAVEGMASGTPFIASDVPGLADVVRDAGLLFKVGDENDLASKIKSLISNDEFAFHIAQQCEKRARMYDISLMIDKTIILYNSLLKNSDSVTY